MKSITSVSLLAVWLLFSLAACAGPLTPPAGLSSTAGPGMPSMTPIAPAPAASAAATTAPTSAAVSPTAQPLPSATRPAATTDQDAPPIAQVRNGGNVRTLPSKQGSQVLDQINTGETVVLRMRAPNGQWYSIVDPRGVIGWVWVGLLTVDPTVAASIPVGSADPGVTASAAPTATPAADVDGPEIIEWEGLRIVSPMGYHHQSRPPDGVRLHGYGVRATLALLSSVPPLEGTEQLNGMIFTLVQFKGTPQEWLDLLRQANDTEFGLDESTVQATTVAGHAAISYQAGPFQEYIVTGQAGTLLLIDNGARIPEHQQVIDSLTLAREQGGQGQDTGQIAYIQDGDQSLWLLDLATIHARQVATGPSHDPAWSPDGQWLAFTGGLENTDIYMIHPDGSDETPITNSPDMEQLPAFAPSGTLFFVRHRLDGAHSAYEIVKHAGADQDRMVYTFPASACEPTDLRFASDTRFALSLTCGPDKGQNVLVGDLNTGHAQDVEHKYLLNSLTVNLPQFWRKAIHNWFPPTSYSQ